MRASWTVKRRSIPNYAEISRSDLQGLVYSEEKKEEIVGRTIEGVRTFVDKRFVR